MKIRYKVNDKENTEYTHNKKAPKILYVPAHKRDDEWIFSLPTEYKENAVKQVKALMVDSETRIFVYELKGIKKLKKGKS